ncbi:hypothetical protein D3C76_1444160 [compost metagenome]
MGHRRDGRQPGHWFETYAHTFAIAFGQGWRIGKEDRIELFPFRSQCKLLVVSDVHGRFRHRLRVTPGGFVMTIGVDEEVEAELTFGHFLFPTMKSLSR